MRREFFEIHGARMAYGLAGEGGPPLVFLHGFACDRSFLAPQTAHFAVRHRVAAVDFLGHGDSDKPRLEYRIPGFAQDTVLFLERLGMRDAVVVGHSMGGAVALEMAVNRPDLVRSAVCLDSTLISSLERKTKGLPAMLAELEAPNYQEAVHRFFGGMFLPSDGTEFKRRIQDIMASAPRHVLVELTKALMHWDGPDLLRRLTRPLLYIGSQNPLTAQAPLLSATPWARYAQAVGSGHFITLVAPEQVNAMIERWLQVLPFAEAES